DLIYAGGDDLLIIMNAKAALTFCQRCITLVAEQFAFSRRLTDGTGYRTCTYNTVTLSCGVAIADTKFPIYFLLDKAREMEKEAKKAFREKITTDNLNLLDLPAGSVACTAVQGAMPSAEKTCFVLPDDLADYGILLDIIRDSLGEDTRPVIRDLVTCGTSAEERLNFIKYNYASALRKQGEAGRRIEIASMMAEVVNNHRIHNATKMIIPLLWHQGGED
ncbi:MAG: hypothetical protein LUQ07_04675, partial [Methanospirillum sp.]|nr:hypothetical protein [Methanospirillum sp.]